LAYNELLRKQFPTIIFMDLKASIRGKVLGKAKVLVGYMNLEDNHWIAAKLDLTQNLAAIADSLYTAYRHKHASIFARLQSIAENAGHTNRLQHFTVEVPNQRNADDCGVFACLFQLFMAQSDITQNIKLTYDSKPTARIMRKRIFTDLMTRKITPLIQPLEAAEVAVGGPAETKKVAGA
jgi:Ulp1 family protease